MSYGPGAACGADPAAHGHRARYAPVRGSRICGTVTRSDCPPDRIAARGGPVPEPPRPLHRYCADLGVATVGDGPGTAGADT